MYVKAFRLFAIVCAIVCVVLWGATLARLFQANLAIIELSRVFLQVDASTDRKVATLRWVQSIKAQNAIELSQRQMAMLSVADRLVALFDAARADANQQLASDPPLSRLNRDIYRLPEPMQINPELNLLAAVVLSDDMDFAFGAPLRVALWLQPTQDALSVSQIRPDLDGWMVWPHSAGFIASGPVPNLIQNPGFEMPSFDPHTVQGLLPTRYWGLGGPGSWQRLRLQELNDGLRGQVACVTGEVRLSVPFKPVEKGRWVMFGARFRTIRGVGTTPYFVALSRMDESTQATSVPNVVRSVPSSSWRFAYGVIRLSQDSLVSLFFDSRGDLENETCVDNLFIVLLPTLSSEVLYPID